MKRLFILILIAILGLGLLMFFYWYYINLETNNIVFTYKSAESKGERVLVLRVQQDKELSFELFSLPAREQVGLLNSYGNYELRAIYPLLKLDKKSEHFINANLAAALGILVNHSVALPEIPNLEDLPSFKKFLFHTALSAQSGLSFRERCLLIKLFFNMNELNFSFQKFDELKSLRVDEDAAGCSVAVINSTSKNGLAKDITDFLERNGFRVVKVGDDQALKADSQIMLSKNEAECSTAAESLTVILPSQSKITVDEELFTQYRSDVVLFLGDDLVN